MENRLFCKENKYKSSKTLTHSVLLIINEIYYKLCLLTANACQSIFVSFTGSSESLLWLIFLKLIGICKATGYMYDQ